VRLKEKEMIIKRYSDVDESPLFEMLIEEGDDWSDYHGEKGRDKYIKALKSSLTYVMYDDNILCGFVRCREDDGFGVYVYDLLVRKSYRGRQLGKMLMEQVCKDFSNQPVYVMSDVDPYYEKLGYRKEGSIFEVKI
jgi:ribosomal protein S18 acetylase RimI-like enzyme